MGADSVASVYAEIIKDVSKHMEPVFHEEGIDHVLGNLTQLWAMRLLNARVLSPDSDTRELTQLAQQAMTHGQAYPAPSTSAPAPHGYPVAPQMVHYPQGYQQNFAAARPPHHLASPATSVPRGIPQVPMGYPPMGQPGYDYSQQQEAYLNQTYLQQPNRPTSAASLPTIANLGQTRPDAAAAGRPRPNLTRPQTTYPGQYPPQGQFNLPQNDGAHDEITVEEIDEALHQQLGQESGEGVIEFEIPEGLRKKGKKKIQKIPQLDGEGDDDDEDPEEGGDSEQENEGGNEESLNSSLDSDDDDQQEETRDLVVCLFEKVTRARTKWRCVLKDGVMNLNGKDYLFHKNTGEFEW